MDYYNQTPQTPPPYRGSGYGIVAQSNAIMKRVYVRMFLGMLISAFVALGVSSSPALLQLIVGNKLIFWGMLIAMLAIAWVVPSRLTRMSSGSVLLCFALFAALQGAFLAPIFIVYRIGTIVYTFFITAGVFGAMSVYGYFTKRDLTKIGSFLVMGLIGLMLVMVVNIFVASSSLDWFISIIGVLIFIGLTAWDTQTVKQLAQSNLDPAMADKLASMAALNLYLDFINMFLFLLRIFGGGDND